MPRCVVSFCPSFCGQSVIGLILLWMWNSTAHYAVMTVSYNYAGIIKDKMGRRSSIQKKRREQSRSFLEKVERFFQKKLAHLK